MTDQQREREIRRRICNHLITVMPKQDGYDLLSLLDAARQQLAERDSAIDVAIGLLTEWLLDTQDNLTSTPRGCDSWQPQKDLEQRILAGLAALEGR